jgi:hypothetical protein
MQTAVKFESLSASVGSENKTKGRITGSGKKYETENAGGSKLMVAVQA